MGGAACVVPTLVMFFTDSFSHLLALWAYMNWSNFFASSLARIVVHRVSSDDLTKW